MKTRLDLEIRFGYSINDCEKICLLYAIVTGGKHALLNLSYRNFEIEHKT